MAGDIRFRVKVKAAVPYRDEFHLTFDFSDETKPVTIWCSRDLSGVDTQRLENLATNFVGNIAEVVFRVQ
jgi:hypothetical protein